MKIKCNLKNIKCFLCLCLKSQSCGQGGVCSEISGEPQCECNLGYRINQISGFCEDVDECTTRTTDNTDKR